MICLSTRRRRGSTGRNIGTAGATAGHGAIGGAIASLTTAAATNRIASGVPALSIEIRSCVQS